MYIIRIIQIKLNKISLFFKNSFAIFLIKDELKPTMPTQMIYNRLK